MHRVSERFCRSVPISADQWHQRHRVIKWPLDHTSLCLSLAKEGTTEDVLNGGNVTGNLVLSGLRY